jgi:hypothetical protein
MVQVAAKSYLKKNKLFYLCCLFDLERSLFFEDVNVECCRLQQNLASRKTDYFICAACSIWSGSNQSS